MSNPQPIYESFSSSIPRKELNVFIAKICLSDIYLLKTMAMLSEMIASKNMTIASLVILAYR